MANMIVSDGKWVLSQEIAGAGTITKLLSTENKFLDKNIEVITSTAAGALSAGAGSAAASSNTGVLGTGTSTQPTSGNYITVTGSGTVGVGTAGWLDTDATQDSATATMYYPLVAATFARSANKFYAATEGYVAAGSASDPLVTMPAASQTVTGGDLSAGAGSAAVASDGYYNGTSYDTTDKVALTTTELEGYYKITASGSGTVNRAAVTSQVTSEGYMPEDVSPVSEIAADSLSSNTATEEYFILKSTLSASSVTPNAATNAQQTVTIGAGYYPTARTVTVEPMAEKTPTTSLANTGLSTYFNAGTSASHDVSLTPQYSNESGYVAAHTNTNNGGIEYLNIKTTSVTEGTTSVSGSTATRGIASWGTGWIEADSIGAAQFKNTATTNVDYVDISGTTDAPVLVSGSYLFIDAGYVDNLKISLAKLVPDGATAALASNMILSGYSAYNNDGVLVAGSIPTYDGAYTVE